MKVVKSLDDSDILIKGVTKAIENEIKNKLLDFLLWSSISKFNIFPGNSITTSGEGTQSRRFYPNVTNLMVFIQEIAS